MDGKDIQGVIDLEPILEFGGIVASDSADNTEDESGPWGHEARSRSNSDQASDDSRAETHSRPLPLESVIQKTPSDTTNRSGEVSHKCCHNSSHVGGKGRASVESEPSNPEKHSANDNVGDVVRAVVELMGAVTTAFPEHQRVRQCC